MQAGVIIDWPFTTALRALRLDWRLGVFWCMWRCDRPEGFIQALVETGISEHREDGATPGNLAVGRGVGTGMTMSR